MSVFLEYFFVFTVVSVDLLEKKKDTRTLITFLNKSKLLLT